MFKDLKPLYRAYKEINVGDRKPFSLAKTEGEHWAIYEIDGKRVPKKLTRFEFSNLKKGNYSGGGFEPGEGKPREEFWYSYNKEDFGEAFEAIYNDIYEIEEASE